VGINTSGVILSSIVLTLACLLSNVSKNYVLESMARADSIYSFNVREKYESDYHLLSCEKLIDHDDSYSSSSSSSSSSLENIQNIQKKYILYKIETNGNNNDNNDDDKDKDKDKDKEDEDEDDDNELIPNGVNSPSLVRSRKFEIIELTSMFLGKKGETFYLIAICLLMYGTLWAYTSVFSSAMSEAIPIAKLLNLDYISDDYTIWCIVFAIIVVPLTCMELKEQISVQIFLSMSRVGMVFFMVGSIVGSFNSSSPQFGYQSSSSGSSKLFNINKIYKIIPIAVFANIFHHSIPGLSSPVKDKKKLGIIFASTFTFAIFAYSTIGILVAWYFGDAIKTSSNLNWTNYHAGTGHIDPDCNADNDNDCAWVNRAWWVNIIAYFVICFPATDVISAFPLNGITLGNSLMGKYYGSRIREYEKKINVIRIWRLVGSVPPIFGAFFVRELGTITDYTGITGFAIAFVFPALLQIYSKREAKRLGLMTTTYYSGWMSGDYPTMFVGFVGVFLIVYVFGSLIYEASSEEL